MVTKGVRQLLMEANDAAEAIGAPEAMELLGHPSFSKRRSTWLLALSQRPSSRPSRIALSMTPSPSRRRRAWR